MLSFTQLEKNHLWKQSHYRRKCWFCAFSFIRMLFSSYMSAVLPMTPAHYLLPIQFGLCNKGSRGLSLILSQTTNFSLFQTERICRRQFLIWWKLEKVLKTGRKHRGKRRNACYEQFLLFPKCFQKTCTTDMWKPRLVWEKVKKKKPLN